jgi:hypothetical protein
MIYLYISLLYLHSHFVLKIIWIRRLIGLSTEGFRISRSTRIQVLSDALPLKGVPTGVIRVAKNVCLSTICSSHMYDSLTTYLGKERHISVA